MSPFAPFTEDQFQYLAMGKARAYTWETLAQQINMPIEIVERVAWTHEKQWNRFLTKAERHVARETIAEIASVLRTDLRNAEPQQHATLANSLSRILKQQQEYAPQKRSRPKVAMPTLPTAPLPSEMRKPQAAPPDMPPPTPKLTTEETVALKERIRARLAGTACALLAFVGLFVLLGTSLMGCWNRPARTHEQGTFVTHEPTACVVVAGPSCCTSGFSLNGPHAPMSVTYSSG